MLPPRILIVDDSHTEQIIASHMIRLLGGDVRLADNGLTAIELCRTAMPDVILLDWNMPEMDGPEVMRTIRSLPQGHKPKIIFCTAEDSYEKIAQVMSSGADSFIIKPFSIDTIGQNLAYVGIPTTPQTMLIKIAS
ncbi:MAG: response regulator [Rhodospirillaceae bacterium]|nr:response regulator [Rhodospirillaceae bacterium]